MQPAGPAQPALRASDLDRERVATLLRENYSDGRLSLEEFQERLEMVYAAKTLGELDTLTADLPVPGSTAPSPTASPLPHEAARQKRVRDRVLTYLLLMAFLVAIWAVSGREGSFWPIWPILVGGLILGFDILGLEHPTRHGRRRRRERWEHRTDRPPGERDDTG
jgi:Domain of unknown function (DUF1707)/2TM domain